MLLACWLLLAVLYALPRAEATPVNAVKNPGFELGTLYWTFSEGASLDEGFAHSGNYSAKIAYSDYIEQVFVPPINSSQVVSFTFWTTRGEGTGGSAPLYISWTFDRRGSDGGINAGTDVDQDNVPVGEWVKIDITEVFLEKAEGRGLVSFSFFRASDNWLQWWIDDVSLLVEAPSQSSQDYGGSLPSNVYFRLSNVDLGAVSPGSTVSFNIPLEASSIAVVSTVRFEGEGFEWFTVKDVLPKAYPSKANIPATLTVPKNAGARAYNVKVSVAAVVGGYTVSSMATVSFSVGMGGSAYDAVHGFLEAVKVAFQRLLGNPLMLWLLILLVLILSYYSLRRR